MKQEDTPQPPKVLCATENNENLSAAKGKTHHAPRCAVTLNIEEFVLVHLAFSHLPETELQKQRSQTGLNQADGKYFHIN